MNDADKFGLAILAKPVRDYLVGRIDAEALVRAVDKIIGDDLLPVMSAPIEGLVLDLHKALALFERSEFERGSTVGLIGEDKLKEKVISFDHLLKCESID